MVFANIEYLFLLLLLIPYIVWYVMRRKKTEPTMQVSTTRMYMQAPRSWKIYLLHAPITGRTRRLKVLTSCWRSTCRPVCWPKI